MIGIREIFMMLAGVSPGLILWVAVVIFAIILLRRGGGRAERFLIAGASLKIFQNLVGIFSVFIVPWLVDKGYEPIYISSVTSVYSIILNIISMVGIICIVYAFWAKFKARGTAEEIPLPQS